MLPQRFAVRAEARLSRARSMTQALNVELRAPLMWFVQKAEHRVGLGSRFFRPETAGDRNLRAAKDKMGASCLSGKDTASARFDPRASCATTICRSKAASGSRAPREPKHLSPKRKIRRCVSALQL